MSEVDPYLRMKRGASAFKFWKDTIVMETGIKDGPGAMKMLSRLYEKGWSIREVLNAFPKEVEVRVDWVDAQGVPRSNSIDSWHSMAIFLDKNIGVRLKMER